MTLRMREGEDSDQLKGDGYEKDGSCTGADGRAFRLGTDVFVGQPDRWPGRGRFGVDCGSRHGRGNDQPGQ